MQGHYVISYKSVFNSEKSNFNDQNRYSPICGNCSGYGDNQLYTGPVNLQFKDATCRKTMTEVTLQCVCVLAPAGRACCRKTAAEIVSVESGSSAYSRHTPLPTDPLSLLHKYKHTLRH